MHPNQKNHITALVIVGVVALIWVTMRVLGGPAPSSAATSSRSNVAEAHTARPTPMPADNCIVARQYEKQSAADLNSDQYSDAYKNAVSGLAKNQSCEDDNEQLINKGYLLSMKGLAEHHLSVGDAETDLNEANANLVSCQTTPGLYGTHDGAQCETQERYNISAATNWQMNQ